MRARNRRCIIVEKAQHEVTQGKGECPEGVREIGGDTGLSVLETTVVEALGIPTLTTDSASPTATN